jgi:Mce-associated membrane protein
VTSNAMTPSLYDLLDVDRQASDAEIRAAWKAAIADLDPTDRRFRAYNQAAEVLLDTDKRAAYDAELVTREDDSAPEPVTEARQDEATPPTAPASSVPTTTPATVVAGLKRRLASPGRETAGVPASGAAQLVPAWLLIGLAVVVAALLAGVVYFANQPSDPSDSDVEEATRAAQSAAETAIVPVLSYDAKTLDEDQSEAQSYMTSDYRSEYDKLFEVLKENAPRTQTAVTAEVVASGIVRSGETRAEILIFVNRPTTNKAQPEPVIYRDQVTVTMQRVAGDWLVDDLKTSPVAQ